MGDAAKGKMPAAANIGQGLPIIAILADAKSAGFEQHAVPLFREAVARGLRPVLVSAVETELGAIAERIPGLSGAIILSEWVGASTITPGLAIVRLGERAVPDRVIDQVVLDTGAAGFRVAEYVASAGRTSVALVGPHGAETPLAQGFAKGIDTYDLMLPRDFVVACPPDSAVAAGIFRAFLRTASVFPQVVYCTDPAVACGVYEALTAEGFKVPRDLWVLSHGETAMTRSPFYDMTSITAPPDAACTAVFDLLCKRLNNVDGERIIRHIGFDIVAKSTTENFYMTKAVP